MPPAIISSRTRSLYETPPAGDFVLNEGCEQAQNLVAFWPLSEGKGRYLDLARRQLYPLTVTGTNGLGQSRDGGRGFANAATTGNYLTCATTPITGAAFTLNAWIYLRDSTDYGRESALVSVCNAGSSLAATGSYTTLVYDGANGEGKGAHVALFDTSGGTTHIAASSTTVAAGGTANMITGVFTSTASGGAAVFLNAGGSAATSGTASTPSGWTAIQAACLRSSTTTFSPLSGVLSWAGAWSVARTAGQIVRQYDPKWRYELAYTLGRTTYSFKAPAAGGGGTVVFRRTLSGLGGRTGARQAQGVG